MEWCLFTGRRGLSRVATVSIWRGSVVHDQDIIPIQKVEDIRADMMALMGLFGSHRNTVIGRTACQKLLEGIESIDMLNEKSTVTAAKKFCARTRDAVRYIRKVDPEFFESGFEDPEELVKQGKAIIFSMSIRPEK